VTEPAATVQAATGAIRDLGYKRYLGTRRATSTRWRVIMRHQIATAWKTWWRYKAAVAIAVIVTFVFGGLMYFATNRIFHGLGRAGDVALTFADAALPMSIQWYCRAAAYLSLTIGAGVIAADLQSGAFTFYFARSLRPRDYVAGKLAGLIVLVGALTLVGPVLLAGLRLGLSDNTDELIAHLDLIPKALAVGALATIAYAAVPLGFSALIPNRRYAVAGWAAYYLVFGTMVATIGTFTGGTMAVLDLPSAVQTVSYALFDVQPVFGRHGGAVASASAGLVSIGIHAAVAIAIAWWRVRRSQLAGIVGSS
jgi:hypothetical protein